MDTINNKNNFIFKRADTPFWNVHIILHFVIFWSIGGGLIFAYFCHPQVLILLFAALWIGFPPMYKYLYYRRKMFEYNEQAILTYDGVEAKFTYKYGGSIIKVVSFSSSDVKQWWYQGYGPYMSTFVEMIELQLNNGEKIIISSGLESAIYFLYDHREELGLPEQYAISRHAKYKSLFAYIDAIG